MRQLTALDAQFLHVETATTAAHVAGLAILDSADGSVTRDALADLLLARLHLSPALSLRVAEVPLGLDHPYWVSDLDFDIDHHLFETTLPLPGDDWQLAEAVAEIHARRLDRAHPLWEMHLINGLENGRVAVYTKVHHAAIDGVSGAETLAALLDLTPDGHLRSRDRAVSTSRTRPSSRTTTALRDTTPPPASQPTTSATSLTTPVSTSARTPAPPPVRRPDAATPVSQAGVSPAASQTDVSVAASQASTPSLVSEAGVSSTVAGADVSSYDSPADAASPGSRATATMSVARSPRASASAPSTRFAAPVPADASRTDTTSFVPVDAEASHTTTASLPAGAHTADISVLPVRTDVPPNGTAAAARSADPRTIDSATVSTAFRRSGAAATHTSTDAPLNDATTGSVLADARTADDTAAPVPADARTADDTAAPVLADARTAGDTAVPVPAGGGMADVGAPPLTEGAGTCCADDGGADVGGVAEGRVAAVESGADGGLGGEGRGGEGEVVPVDRRRERRGDGGGDGGPGWLGMLAGAAARTVTHPVTAVRSVVRAAGDLDAIPLFGGVPGAKLIAKAVRMVSGERLDRPEMPRLTAPRTPFNGPISGRRHLSFGSLSLKDVKKIAKANGISVNDVVMTLCTSALRSWLRERDALPEAPLVVAVPVAVRTGAAKDVVGNQISAMVAPLPTNVDDPGERLQAVGDAMARAKRRFALSPATWPSELCSMLPALVTSLATPAIFRLAGVAFPPINLIISNVPGPQFPLYLCGGRLLSYYPLSVLTDLSGGLSITCFSYDGMIDFGLVACPERVDDVWSLVDHLRTALDELLDERVGDEFRDGLGIDLVAG